MCQVDADQIALCSGGAVVDKGRHEALIRSQKVNFTLYSGFHVYIRSDKNSPMFRAILYRDEGGLEALKKVLLILRSMLNIYI